MLSLYFKKTVANKEPQLHTPFIGTGSEMCKNSEHIHRLRLASYEFHKKILMEKRSTWFLLPKGSPQEV